MSYEQALHTGLPGNGRGLDSGAVKTSAGLGLEVFEVGGLVIEQVDTVYIAGDAFVEHRVCCICIGPGLVGGVGHPLILDNASVLFLVALAPFQPIEEGSRDIMLAGLIGIDAAEGADFAEDEP